MAVFVFATLLYGSICICYIAIWQYLYLLHCYMAVFVFATLLYGSICIRHIAIWLAEACLRTYWLERSSSIGMNEKLTVFRAGTKDGPSFSFSGDHSVRVKSGVRQQTRVVWMVTKSDLYYPLKQGEKTTVRLFKADVWPSDFDELKVKNHSKYSGICLAESESTKQLKEQLESLDWKEIKLETCNGGMSRMDFSTLVRAVLVYMKDHYPTTPDEYNFQAELKAASHWYWYPKSNENPGHEEEACTSIKPPELVSGPHKDNRVKIAALETCRKWISVLEGLKKESSPNKRSKRVKEDEESSPDEDENEERIYDLEESIFDLKTYFDFKDDELSKSRTKVTGKHSSVKSKMACSKKSSETKEIAGRKIVRVKVRGQVISQTK